MAMKECGDGSFYFYIKGEYPSLGELRLPNASLFKEEIQFFHQCPKLVDLRFGFDFGSERFARVPGASAADALEAIQSQAAQLTGLHLTVDNGTPPDNMGTIGSLEKFSALKEVSIAAGFITNASDFVDSLPRSVATLTMIGDGKGVCEALKKIKSKRPITVKHLSCQSDCVSGA
ncbi:hypothetical protein LY78DRAFT_664086, partial [Colletotrichum sublineola]